MKFSVSVQRPAPQLLLANLTVPSYSRRVKRPGAIRQQGGSKTHSNIIGGRVQAARHRHDPTMTLERARRRATALIEYEPTMSTVAKIGQGVRHACDFEVMALALVTGVDARWLFGLTDDPGPLSLLSVPEEPGTENPW